MAIMNVPLPDPWPDLIRVCITMINSHVANNAVHCFARWPLLLKPGQVTKDIHWIVETQWPIISKKPVCLSLVLTLLLPSSKSTFSQTSNPFTHKSDQLQFSLQPHQKHNIIQCEERVFLSLTHDIWYWTETPWFVSPVLDWSAASPLPLQWVRYAYKPYICSKP